MRFQYRTIRATPDPTRILEIGVGVLVTDPRNGNSIVATIERPESLPSQVQERDAIFSALRRLATRFRDTHSGANRIEFTDSDTATGLASRLEDHWNNFLTIDPPRTMSAESIEEASDLLFNIYIAAPRSETAPRSITRLRRTVQSAYRQHPAIERHLRQAPHLNTLAPPRTRSKPGTTASTTCAETADNSPSPVKRPNSKSTQTPQLS